MPKAWLMVVPPANASAEPQLFIVLEGDQAKAIASLRRHLGSPEGKLLTFGQADERLGAFLSGPSGAVFAVGQVTGGQPPR